MSVSRTVLVYMIANNNLGSSYHSDERDIQEMLKGVEGGKLNNGRLLVYITARTIIQPILRSFST